MMVGEFFGLVGFCLNFGFLGRYENGVVFYVVVEMVMMCVGEFLVEEGDEQEIVEELFGDCVYFEIVGKRVVFVVMGQNL